VTEENQKEKQWQRDYHLFFELYLQAKYCVVKIGLLSTPQDKFFDSQLLIQKWQFLFDNQVVGNYLPVYYDR